MKHSIIKDFIGWQRVFEAETVSNPTSEYTPPASAGKTLPEVTVTAPAALVKYPAASIKSPDGRLNKADSIAIQRVLINGTYLLPKFKSDKTGQEKPSDDGVIGKRSIAAINQFRTAHGVSDAVAPTATKAGVTIGPATLAKFNEIISDPKKLVIAPNPEKEAAAQAQAELQMGEEEMARLDAEKKAKDAADKAAADAAIQAATDKGNETVSQIMKMITDQFTVNKDFFKEFETGFLRKDNVLGAVGKFTEWFNQNIAPLAASLPDTDKNKALFGPNGATLLGNITAGITNKTNRLQVPYTDPTGNPTRIVVNADF